MTNLLRKRHDGSCARNSLSNRARHAPRTGVPLFSPCQVLATAPGTRTGSLVERHKGTSRASVWNRRIDSGAVSAVPAGIQNNHPG